MSPLPLKRPSLRSPQSGAKGYSSSWTRSFLASFPASLQEVRLQLISHTLTFAVLKHFFQMLK